MSGVNFERNKKQQEYKAPALRPSCWNCKHHLAMVAQCSKGGFYVQSYATCKDHKHQPESAA